MRKLTALFVASGLMLGTANLALATEKVSQHEGKPMMHHKRGPAQDMLFKNLNLSDEQKQQISDIRKAQREKMPRPDVNERRAFHDIITSDNFDSAKAQQAVDKMAERSKTHMLARLETQNKIYNILTPEQKKQFNDNFEKHLTKRQTLETKAAAPAE